MKRSLAVSIALLLLTAAPALAQPGEALAPEDPRHEELRALRREVVDASNRGHIDAVLALLDENVVVTWLNGEVSRGPAGVREYLVRMTEGPDRVVDRFETNPQADALTELYGDVGIAYGHSNDLFVLTDGREFVVPTRWSAAVVRNDDGGWKIASFHASTNMFENPILEAHRRAWTWVAAAAFVVGAVLTGVLAWVMRRRSRPAA